MEKIVCSAIWYKDFPLKKPSALDKNGFRPKGVDRGIVFSGLRHFNCICQMIAITGLKDSEIGEKIQGFLTDSNRFVTREEAATIAYESKQIKQKRKILYSEDLF